MRLDILIFALIAGYIFFRLWRVFGVRIEVERVSFSPDEVVVLRNANPSHEEKDNILPMIQKLQKHEPSFDPEHFIQAAERMLIKIVEAYSKNDKNILRKFVSPPLCEAFEAKITERQNAKQERHVEVLSVAGSITSIEVPSTSKQQATPARIFVTFISEQIIYTTESDGSSYDNPSHLPTQLSDNWVFARMIGSDNPIWHVESTSSQQYRET